MKISDAMVEAFEVAYELAWDTRAGIAAALKAGGFKEETRVERNTAAAKASDAVFIEKSRLVGPWEQKT